MGPEQRKDVQNFASLQDTRKSSLSFNSRFIVLSQCARALRSIIIAHQALQLKLFCISNLSGVCCSVPVHSRQSDSLAILWWHGWWTRVNGVEMQQHVREKEHQEGEAIYHQHVRDVGNSRI
jgi:hypothetical protein